MKRASMLLAFALLVLLTGCAPPKPDDQKKIVVMIRQVAESGSNLGLNYLDKKDHKAAVKTAEEMNKTIVEVVLPYLNGEAVSATSFAVNELLQEKFFSKLDENVKLTIVAAAAVLDTYLTPPDPTKHLSEAELAYIKAFFEGVAAGTDDFLKKPAVTMKVPNVKPTARWFR